VRNPFNDTRSSFNVADALQFGAQCWKMSISLILHAFFFKILQRQKKNVILQQFRYGVVVLRSTLANCKTILNTKYKI